MNPRERQRPNDGPWRSLRWHGANEWGRTRGALGVVVVAAACAPIAPPQGSAATTNSCPEHPCGAYAASLGGTPSCDNGACLVLNAGYQELILAVQIPEDSSFAPGQTYLLPFDSAFVKDPTLPAPVDTRGLLVAQPNQAVDVSWNLGNPGQNTALPVQATFRRLWPDQPCTSPLAPPGFEEAAAAGLPVLPVQADAIVFPNPDPGPQQGPSLAFDAALQPGCYERTIAPLAPLDRAFPPDVAVVAVAAGSSFAAVPLVLDTTKETGEGQTFPQFQITSSTPLDGYSAYLRDATTTRVLSNVSSLAGTSPTVLLATDHHPTNGDALQSAELVVAAPAGQPTPNWVVAPLGGVLPSALALPDLPSSVTVSGSVTLGGSQVDASLVFQANGIYQKEGGTLNLNTENYEFSVTTQTNATDANGNRAFSVELPQGQYTVTIAPIGSSMIAPDGGAASAAGVTVLPLVDVTSPAQTVALGLLGLSPLRSVSGFAKVADGRPLAGATVEALPIACGGTAGASASCLPSAPAPATTASNGTFALSLSDGGYYLRVRPADGTNLPWAVQYLLVTPSTSPVTVEVQAPFYKGATLTLQGSLVTNALVRVFDGAPGSTGVGPPLPDPEIARAITDSNGHFDIYLAPPSK